MFNGNQRSARDMGQGMPPAPSAPVNSGNKRGAFSVIGTDVVITGNVKATADLHIDGRIEGDVECGSVVQGTESLVKGSLAAQSARLAGTIDGAVSVRQLTVERTARILGDVEYEAIAIENGAQIDGRLKHVSSETAPMMPSAPAEHQDGYAG